MTTLDKILLNIYRINLDHQMLFGADLRKDYVSFNAQEHIKKWREILNIDQIELSKYPSNWIDAAYHINQLR